jgi:hypothetical protein
MMTPRFLPRPAIRFERASRASQPVVERSEVPDGSEAGEVFVVAAFHPSGSALSYLTSADLMTRSEAVHELAQWRRHGGRRYVLCRVEVVDQ